MLDAQVLYNMYYAEPTQAPMPSSFVLFSCSST